MHDQVAAEGSLRGADLEALAVGVAAALTAIHDAGVVHRDLKPANVLLSPFGPRVIDFGVARVMDLTRLSVDGSVLGTPSFMAPEQVRSEPVTAAADVFAWGAVVAFAAHGQPPFQAESPAAVMHQILTGEPDLSGLDGALHGQVRAALSKRADQRPTAHDILRNLISSGVPGTAADVLDTATEDVAAEPPPDTGRPRGAGEAEVWYRRAAEAGDVQAAADLGDLLCEGGRVEEAERWYRKAIDVGSDQAMVKLGWLQEQRGETEEAEGWYRRAADVGNAWAMRNLGWLWEQRGADPRS